MGGSGFMFREPIRSKKHVKPKQKKQSYLKGISFTPNASIMLAKQSITPMFTDC